MGYEPSMSCGMGCPPLRPRPAAAAGTGTVHINPNIRNDLSPHRPPEANVAPMTSRSDTTAPSQLAATIQVEGNTAMTPTANSALSIGDCETIPLEAWRTPLASADLDFLRAKLRFIFDIGHALTRQRETAGLTRAAAARAAGIYRATLHAIETGQRPHQDGREALAFEGSYIGKIVQALSAFDGFIPVDLMCRNAPGQRLGQMMLSPKALDDNEVGKSVRALRIAANLTQTQLDALLHQTEAGPGKEGRASPMISRIENGQQRNGPRLGTFFALCQFCVVTPVVQLEEVPQAWQS